MLSYDLLLSYLLNFSDENRKKTAKAVFLLPTDYEAKWGVFLQLARGYIFLEPRDIGLPIAGGAVRH